MSADKNRTPAELRDLPLFYGLGDNIVEIGFHEPSSPLAVPEALTQSIWEQGRFVRRDLKTIDGRSVEIRAPGLPNPDAGPDFLRARIRIGDMEWTGDVEIHNTSAQWFEHRHHLDTRYNSVVLHVTLQADMWTGRLTRADSTTVPEIVLHPLLESTLRSLLYHFHSRDRRPIPCAGSWQSVDDALKDAVLDQMGVQRLRSRLEALPRHPSEVQLERVLYERILASLGYSKNAAPMVDLARRIPLCVARSVDPEDLEALFLGTADLLPSPADLLNADRATADRAMEYRHTFERLRHVMRLEPMRREEWLFFRLRPANFPPIRIAQAAAMIRPGGLLHANPLRTLRRVCLDTRPVRALRKSLEITLPDFWENHIRLDRRSRASTGTIGRQRIDQIILNAILPILSLLPREPGGPDYSHIAVDLARRLPAERNEVTRVFENLDTEPRSALHSQGMYALYHGSCLAARCLSCPIGGKILGSPVPHDAAIASRDNPNRSHDAGAP
jgi:hypothetical protein